MLNIRTVRELKAFKIGKLCKLGRNRIVLLVRALIAAMLSLA